MNNAFFGRMFFTLALLCHVFAAPAAAQTARVTTNMGAFDIELYPDKAPKTVANFLSYVDSGYYDGTIFHRVIDGFMAQGGGYDANYQPRQTRPPVANESDNSLSNTVGTVAMARTGDPHSATAQFFINVQDNAFLDFAIAPNTAVNTMRGSRLAVQDKRSGKVATADCRGRPVTRDAVTQAKDPDFYACLMQSAHQDQNHIGIAMQQCFDNADELKQSGAMKSAETCADSIGRGHRDLKFMRVRWGYTVFGAVVAGMEVIDRIKAVATGSGGPFPKDAPLQTITIESIRRI